MTSSDSALVFAPEGGFPGAGLVAARPGDGSSADITALYATQGTGVPGQIVYGDFCLTSEGVVPGTATQTLYFAECSDSPAQVWTVNESGTVSNADGNCVTLGRAAVNVPVRLPCVRHDSERWMMLMRVVRDATGHPCCLHGGTRASPGMEPRPHLGLSVYQCGGTLRAGKMDPTSNNGLPSCWRITSPWTEIRSIVMNFKDVSDVMESMLLQLMA